MTQFHDVVIDRFVAGADDLGALAADAAGAIGFDSLGATTFARACTNSTIAQPSASPMSR